MWIRTATNKSAVHLNSKVAYSYIDGVGEEEFYFDEDIAAALEQDGFLTDMWTQMDALFDWGDCDFFLPDKCRLFKIWLEQRLARGVSDTLRPIYTVMLDYADKAIKYDTGISFDF